MVHPIVQGFPWRRFGGNPAWRPGKYADFARRSIRRLREWGLAVPNDCRLCRVERLLREAHGNGVPAEEVQRKLFAEAARTAMEFYFGTHGPSGVPSEAMLLKCQQALSGADVPDAEQQHFARDIQFELYVHGTLSAGGAAPWFDECPDIRMNFGRDEIGVAVKRLWSQERAHNQLSDAADQIEKSGVRGVIATNGQEYLENLPADEAVEVRGDAFNQQVARFHGQFPYLARKPHVIGVILCGTVAQWAIEGEDGPDLRIASYNQVFAIGNNEEEEVFARQFYDSIGDSLGRWIGENL